MVDAGHNRTEVPVGERSPTGPLLRVLLVQDDTADLRWFEDELRGSAPPWCELDNAATLVGAIERVQAGGIDAVLLDLCLPDARGLEAVTRMRAAATGLPIVVLAGLDDERVALNALKEGAQDYLIKDRVSGSLLARAVRHAVERKRVEEAQRRVAAADEVARLREQFVAVLGHDLRNPLSSIAMNAALLLKQADMTERQLKIVARMARSADRMNRMIGDLLDFTRSRLGGGYPLAPSTGSLVETFRQVIDELETVYQDRALALAADGRVVGTWDLDRLAQLASNLIANGLQHSAADTPVRVTLREDGPDAVIEVNHRGAAIPPHLLPALFEPFARVQTGFGEGQGLGLGLYIARQIVLAHRGRIEARSDETDGSTITVRLPRAG